MIISCHQPNFLPWIPYFEKIQQSDLFVILENVQFARHQFQNRFEFDDKWHTMSVNKGNLSDLIKDKKYIKPDLSWAKIKKSTSVRQLSQFDDLICENLSMTNVGIINEVCKMLKIQTSIVKDAESKSLDASEKLLEICLQYGATTYLSGPSGKKYLNEEIFNQNGIKVRYFEATDKESILKRMV